MRKNLEIKNVKAIEILDGNGIPTIEVEVSIKDSNICGVCRVPSNETKSTFEAVDLRDLEKNRYSGNGVQKAVENINKKISKKIIGMNIFDQRKLDEELIKLDDTLNKSNLGSNAIFGTSVAIAKAASNALNMELYEYIGGINIKEIPTPIITILHGGKNVENNMNFKEIMIIPIDNITFAEKIRISYEIQNELDKCISINNELECCLKSDENTLDIVMDSIKKAGFKIGKEINIGINIGRNKKIDDITKIIEKYPIMYLEDPLDNENWVEWEFLSSNIDQNIDLVGNDLFVTNINRLNRAIEKNIANSIIIKPNQIGTLTETLDIIKNAKDNGYTTIISKRERETDDTYLADIAVRD